MQTSDNTASDAPTTYHVLSHRFEEVEKKVEKLNRRASKLGLAPFEVKVLGEEIIEEEDAYGKTGRVLVVKVVEIHGEAPVVAGHTFVARVEHTEAGNIISKAPGCQDAAVPNEIRDGAPICDHCKTNRRRNDTFVLREDASGKFIRVGRNCLADFLRTADAADALRIWSFMQELVVMSRDMDEPFDSFGSHCYDLSLAHFVACAARSIETDGWVSRKQARDEDTQATANSAAWAAGRRPMDRYSVEAWEKAQPSDANRREATAAIEWAKTLEGSSDYEHNLKVVCSLPYVKTKNHGVAASVLVAYRRVREQEFARQQTENQATEAYFGAVDSRYVRKLTIGRVNSWNNDFGVTVLYTMQDEDGNSFKWFSAGGCQHPEGHRGLDVGDSFYFTFAVKSHGEYKGHKETTIARATPSVEAPTHKWFNPTTGEIFKTKKAMKAAMA